MADIITGTTTGFVNNMPDQTLASVSDVRREAAEHTNEIANAVKDARYDIVSSLDSDTDRIQSSLTAMTQTLTDRFFAVGRDTADLRAQVTAVGYQVRDGFTTAAKDAEINALKTQIELSKQTTYISDKIDADGEKTRALINNLKYNDLNRDLIERNTLLAEERGWGRRWFERADLAQYQALNNQLQAFQSQLQETRQGMVNFGTMAGVGQSSTSNNVR
jgi:hypothetical protein